MLETLKKKLGARLPTWAGGRGDAPRPIDASGAALFDDEFQRKLETLALVSRLEQFIRKAPEQYLWLYKKFKRRPAPYPDLYR